MNLRHPGAIGEGLAVTGYAGLEGVDDLRVSDDYSDRFSMLTGGDYFPVFVSAELRESEATRDFQGVLVLSFGVVLAARS